MYLKLELIFLLAKHPKGLSTDFFYKALGANKKYIRGKLRELKNEKTVKELDIGYWRLERTPSAYSSMWRVFRKYSPRFSIEFEFYNSAYFKAMVKKFGEEKLKKIKFSPPTKRELLKFVKRQKREAKAHGGAKLDIILLLANKLDGVDTKVINKNLLKNKRWIRGALKELEGQELIKRYPSVRRGSATIWKLNMPHIQNPHHSYILLGVFTRAGRIEEFSNTDFAKKMRVDLPNSGFSRYLEKLG